MPTFHLADAEASGVVNYFNALSKLEIPFTYFDPTQTSPDMVHAGDVLMSNDYFACFSCHQQGDQKPEGPPDGWAPDLDMAKERLNPEWIVEWIKAPSALMPDTKMPTFYPGGPDDIFDGDEDKQIVAMRDYIMLLGIEKPFAETNGAVLTADLVNMIDMTDNASMAKPAEGDESPTQTDPIPEPGEADATD
jgi:mono/diheme cytochrome c family protein